MKVSWVENQFDKDWNIERVTIVREGKKFSDRMAFEEVGTIGGGGNSGFQSLNLAAQLGAKRVLLVGFDMSRASGLHWYGRNSWVMANNPDDQQLARWARIFDQAAPELNARDVEVVNAAPHSAIMAFPKMTVEEALARWQ